MGTSPSQDVKATQLKSFIGQIGSPLDDQSSQAGPIDWTLILDQQKALEMAKQIVSQIRSKTILASIINPKADPWDEQMEGLGWLKNEIESFDRMYVQKFKPSNLQDAKNVRDATFLLSKRPLDYLVALAEFIMSGGTGSDEWSDFYDNRALLERRRGGQSGGQTDQGRSQADPLDEIKQLAALGQAKY